MTCAAGNHIAVDEHGTCHSCGNTPLLYKRPRSGCINCGEDNDGGYEVEDGPGPFCSLCWEALEFHFSQSKR